MIRRTHFAMGTFLTLCLEGDGDLQPSMQECFEEVHRLEEMLSFHRPSSDISRINQSAGSAPVHVSTETYRVIEEALCFSELTSGAFDPTAGSAAGTTYRQVQLDPENQTVFLATSGMRLDLGGIGKGFALDRVVEKVHSMGRVESLFADFGGQLLFWNRRGDFAPETVAIENPLNREAILSSFQISTNGSVSTSSNTERRGHLLDPGSGKPTQGTLSVTVFAETATEAEVLSTALFVTGDEECHVLLEKFPEAKVYRFNDVGRQKLGLNDLHSVPTKSSARQFYVGVV